MTRHEEQELAEVTRRAVARWNTLTPADRAARLKAAGILDETGELSRRYRSTSTDADGHAAAPSR
jgi:hypothetical protein